MQNNCMVIDIDSTSGGISSLKFVGDTSELNWVDGDKTHGTLYGNYAVISVGQTAEDECGAVYTYKGLDVTVTRKLTDGGLINRYIFENKTVSDMSFEHGELGITMPFNDNYESSNICLVKKCHMHIWSALNTAYVACKRMNGEGNNLGVLLSRGKLDGYAINRAWDSNDRGDLTMLLPKCNIPANGNIVIEFLMFKYDDFDDFYAKALHCPNFLRIDADKYAVEQGGKISCDISTIAKGDINTNIGNITKTEKGYHLDVTMLELGEQRLEISYGDKLSTYADFYVYSTVENEIDERLDFIIDKQMINVRGRFHGAIMLYDNEKECTFVENRAMNDRNFSRERMCMMTSLIERVMRGGLSEEREQKYKQAIEIGMNFIDKHIVRDNGQVYEKPTYKRIVFYDRPYNYSWAMLIYITMYEYSGDKKYLNKACNIARVYYTKKGGTKFYAILLPLSRIIEDCERASYVSLAREMRGLFLAHGDKLIEIGVNYPAHEVKYEQSIVAPSVDILLECYKISKDRKYLDEVDRQLPLLSAFNGAQPSYHNNEIAIRHWDGFWFGKRKMYGDTFPHYWSCITGMVYSKYATLTGRSEYQTKADICLSNNLSLVQGGRGSCAYLMPDFINGKSGKYFDPWANDQDWLLWYNIMYNTNYKANTAKK